MKISRQASETKNSITPVNGSTSVPIVSGDVPVAALPNGSPSNLMPKISRSCPKSCTPSELKNTIQLMTHDRPISPMAIVWLSTLLRLANSTISANDSSGGSGMSHVRLWSWSIVNDIEAPIGRGQKLGEHPKTARDTTISSNQFL